jgi:hypothetical protein
MFRRACLIGTLAVLVIAPPLWAQDDDKDKPKEKQATPAEQFRKFTQDFQKDRQELNNEFRAAKTDEEREAIRERAQKPTEFAKRALMLAQDNADDPVAVDALLWVVRSAGQTDEATKAMDILLKDHIDSPKLTQSLLSLGYGPVAEKIARTILETSQDQNTKGTATYALAQNFSTQSQIAARQNEAEATRLSEQADRLFEELLSDYPDLKIGNRPAVEAVFQMLGRSSTGDKVLRKYLTRDLEHDVQGKATFVLAQILKGKADKAAGANDDDQAAKHSAEAGKLFERVIADFGEIEYSRRKLPDGTEDVRLYREIAAPELFELKYLAIGKTVPEIEGEDTDGETFKLSDYRGKVVMIDFWGHW